MPRYEQRMAKLHCNNCGHEFEDLAWHEAIQSTDLGVIGWTIASNNAFAGVACPKCSSTLIGAQHR